MKNLNLWKVNKYKEIIWVMNVCVGGGGVCINFMDMLIVYKVMYCIEYIKNLFLIECLF